MTESDTHDVANNQERLDQSSSPTPRSDEASVQGRSRAARVDKILALIEADFAEPQFSTCVLAERLGISSRYIQVLLKSSNISASGRIRDLRLDKAQAMLLDDREGTLKISEIALRCGFNELSYFHRCFRKRFGASPAKFRAMLGGG